MTRLFILYVHDDSQRCIYIQINLTLELPHQSNRLVLQFYKFVNPRLGIMEPDGLIISKMYYITWTFVRK